MKAVSMEDFPLNPSQLETQHMPPCMPLAMPTQFLGVWPEKKAITPWKISKRVLLARLFVFGFSIFLTSWGTYQIYKVVSVNGVSWLQILFACLFALTFAWIAFSCASAVLGFWRFMLRGKRKKAPPSPIITTKTALLMPIYHEDPVHVFKTLKRIGEELSCLDAAQHFDIFVLSDSRNPAAVASEIEAYHTLSRDLSGKISIFYRHRRENTHRKAGNIGEWVTHWGGGYDHMIILDADSFMESALLLKLVCIMQEDKNAGIIQSAPFLFNKMTLFARLQQFCGRIYGPVIAEGLAAWHGRDGNYWGHNAIIRVKAFAQAGGLPELPGKKPFGGDILSHDFVEAALLRRAGWSVSMRPELVGSYEESPPTLLELSARDRRWAQGNLQHSKVLFAKGLHWISRVHLLQGIFSYLASPIWLCLLLVGLALSLQAQFTTPNYFPDGFSLFPSWPVFDPERALNLFYVTMVVLFLPKFLGLFAALSNREIRRSCGGGGALIAGFILENILSALLAPMMMLTQSHVVFDILRGRDSGWASQNRKDGTFPFSVAFQACWKGVVVGILMAFAASLVSWDTVLWMSPIASGLIFSPFLIWLTASVKFGSFLRNMNIFKIPEEN